MGCNKKNKQYKIFDWIVKYINFYFDRHIDERLLFQLYTIHEKITDIIQDILNHNKNYQFSCSNIYEKNKVFYEVKNIIYKLSLNNQKKILACISGKKIRPQYKDFFLNKHDVKSMDCSFVNFGSHGHSHLNYKFSSKKEILDDIIRSKIVLKKIFKKDPKRKVIALLNFCKSGGFLEFMKNEISL